MFEMQNSEFCCGNDLAVKEKENHMQDVSDKIENNFLSNCYVLTLCYGEKNDFSIDCTSRSNCS